MPEANNQDEVLEKRAEVNKKEDALRKKWKKLSDEKQEEFDLEDAISSADKPEEGDYSDTALQQLKDLLDAYEGYDERIDELAG